MLTYNYYKPFICKAFGCLSFSGGLSVNSSVSSLPSVCFYFVFTSLNLSSPLSMRV